MTYKELWFRHFERHLAELDDADDADDADYASAASAADCSLREALLSRADRAKKVERGE